MRAPAPSSVSSIQHCKSIKYGFSSCQAMATLGTTNFTGPPCRGLPGNSTSRQAPAAHSPEDPSLSTANAIARKISCRTRNRVLGVSSASDQLVEPEGATWTSMAASSLASRESLSSPFGERILRLGSAMILRVRSRQVRCASERYQRHYGCRGLAMLSRRRRRAVIFVYAEQYKAKARNRGCDSSIRDRKLLMKTDNRSLI